MYRIDAMRARIVDRRDERTRTRGTSHYRVSRSSAFSKIRDICIAALNCAIKAKGGDVLSGANVRGIGTMSGRDEKTF